jgi:hypothetical protein
MSWHSIYFLQYNHIKSSRIALYATLLEDKIILLKHPHSKGHGADIDHTNKKKSIMISQKDHINLEERKLNTTGSNPLKELQLHRLDTTRTCPLFFSLFFFPFCFLFHIHIVLQYKNCRPFLTRANSAKVLPLSVFTKMNLKNYSPTVINKI